MANNYKWKDKYYNVIGEDVTNTAKYHSKLGQLSGTGTRENPYSDYRNFADGNSLILSGGYYKKTFAAANNGIRIVGGTGAPSDVVLELDGVGIGIALHANDITLKKAVNIFNGSLINCIINGSVELAQFNTVKNTLVEEYANQLSYNLPKLGTNLSFLGLELSLSLGNMTYQNMCVFAGCNILIADSSVLNSLRNNYHAFDNCNFKIGSETSYTALTGNTETDIRQSFVERCEAQGFTVPTVPDLGENLKMGRWVFAKDSTTGGCVIENSIIDNFQSRKYIYLGWKQYRAKDIAITTDPNVPNSLGFDSRYIGNNIEITNNTIKIKDSVDITDLIPLSQSSVVSNVIYLGEGKRRIDQINILNNLFVNSGLLTGYGGLDFPFKADSIIDGGKSYVVRSIDSSEATVTYNGKTYSSSLSERNNILIGINGISFADSHTDNAWLAPILDLSNTPYFYICVVDEIPNDIITSGTLDYNYLYFVEPNDLSSPSGYVTYNGIQYPPYSSFAVYSEFGNSFTITGNCHLRRCWNVNFNFNTEVIDRDFWENRQKPIFSRVNVGDMRCFMKNNNQNSGEMLMMNNGRYFMSGEDGFYDNITGESGFIIPAYPITGRFMQLRVTISTANPM